MSIVTELFNSGLYFFGHERVQSILGVSIARLQLRYKFSLLLAAWWSIEHLIHYEWIRNIPVYYELLDPSIKRKEVSPSLMKLTLCTPQDSTGNFSPPQCFHTPFQASTVVSSLLFIVIRDAIAFSFTVERRNSRWDFAFCLPL